jgi:hypothetical protein
MLRTAAPGGRRRSVNSADDSWPILLGNREVWWNNLSLGTSPGSAKADGSHFTRSRSLITALSRATTTTCWTINNYPGPGHVVGLVIVSIVLCWEI